MKRTKAPHRPRKTPLPKALGGENGLTPQRSSSGIIASAEPVVKTGTKRKTKPKAETEAMTDIEQGGKSGKETEKKPRGRRSTKSGTEAEPKSPAKRSTRSGAKPGKKQASVDPESFE